jgi:outer membrane protein TolC
MAAAVLLTLVFCSCAGPPPPAVDRQITPPVLQDAPAWSSAAEGMQAYHEAGPIELTVEKAVIFALENNQALRVESFNPAIVQTAEDEARAVFDPLFSGSYAWVRERIEAGPSFPADDETIEEHQAGLGVSSRLPTGTDVEIGLSTGQTRSDPGDGDLHETRVGLSVTQALLQGFGPAYNLATLRQARLDTAVSTYELRSFTEALVALVEETYWDYALMQRQIEIYLESLRLSEQQKQEIEEMIAVGSLAESELAAAEAEIALRREGLINARSSLERTRITLLSLLNPPGKGMWNRHVELLVQPTMPDVRLDEAERHVELALKMRPDLNQARLLVHRGEIELVRTRNGLLPRMDFFITLGKTGYADSFHGSFEDLDSGSYDVGAGLRLALPPVNRQARAEHRRALLSRDQAEEALENVARLVQVDVRSAHIEVGRAREQVAATAATRALQEEKARIEREKFRVGKSTSLLVAQAQRDLLSSRISEVQAVANYLKSLTGLYRLEGSLLERRGIRVNAPGEGPGLRAQ